MVGDDLERDIRGAAAAGINTIRIDRSRTQTATGADITLADLSDVPAAADSLVRKVSAHAA
jgi:FMN phosphatase YigB (HAD superfamily)